MKYKVAILQHRLFHYRTDLFERLRRVLAERNVELHLVHGQASKAESVRKDEGNLDWADRVENRYWRIFGRDLCWQPFPKYLRDSDLIILMQENKILSNYPLMLKRFFGRKNLAYWGHGANLQSIAPTGLRERWKSMLISQVDWWFAYTDLTVNILKKAGFPDNKITCLNNAIDETKFQGDLEGVPDSMLTAIKEQLNIDDRHQIGLFCGSLYAEKKLDLLVEAAELIHERVPEFVLIVIGDGPSAPLLHEAFKSRPWAHCVGVKRGVEKAAYFRLAKVMLNPGALGLHVLDAFSAGLPLISTKESLHGPEIVYVEHGINGFLTADNPCDYADVVVQLLLKENIWISISKAARSAAALYTLDNMVHNFADGITQYLEKCKLIK